MVPIHDKVKLATDIYRLEGAAPTMMTQLAVVDKTGKMPPPGWNRSVTTNNDSEINLLKGKGYIELIF